ncbi:MAG: hypothetical protein K8H88_23880 [Sandaracinaceae bacterium]|nr:hypothetical protein [Sandaracinaceae bacterium]
MHAPTSGLEVRTSFNPLQWVFYMCKPAVEINGHRFDVPWGTQVAPMPPGQYHVKIYVPYLFGPACVAETQVQIHPGHVTGLAYETAFFIFMAGSIRQLGVRPC